ncbi:MAG: CIA30 family protein, partial [Candidatus Thiodiazotropha sp. (ex Gloverina cf. vestifex)]|nr:CIA30 family protein [Candidatus Thiodiazotropha sp. (ex Gloverina cf. vestifex)]
CGSHDGVVHKQLCCNVQYGIVADAGRSGHNRCRVGESILGTRMSQNLSRGSDTLVEVFGNQADYNLHLRSNDVWLPWQSYRASFQATPSWQTVKLPFDRFVGYRIDKALDTRHLKRVGLVAIGSAFAADLCIARVEFYREN